MVVVGGGVDVTTTAVGVALSVLVGTWVPVFVGTAVVVGPTGVDVASGAVGVAAGVLVLTTTVLVGGGVLVVVAAGVLVPAGTGVLVLVFAAPVGVEVTAEQADPLVSVFPSA